MSGQRGKGVPWHGSASRDAPLRRWTVVRQVLSSFFLLLFDLWFVFLCRSRCGSEIVFDRLELRVFLVELRLQDERGAEARFIFLEPTLGIGGAATLLIDLRVDMIDDVLEPGDEPERRGVGLDLDVLREIATLQDEQGDRQCRSTLTMNFGLEVETTDAADMPAGAAALAGADP